MHMPAIDRNHEEVPQPLPAGSGGSSCATLSPAWSQAGVDRTVPAARINQGNLEAMQWIAFLAMVIDHVGYLMPKLTAGAVAEVMWMRGVGRVAAPIFCLVFAWRLAHMLWRNPHHDFLAMGFRLAACTMAAEIIWRLAVPPDWPVNIVAGFLGALVIVVLLQEDRGWAAPLLGRWAMASLVAWWVVREVDYGFMGLFLTLGLYGFFRYADTTGRNIAFASLLLLTLGYKPMMAAFALPLVVCIHHLNQLGQSQHPYGFKVSVSKPVPGLFYWLYPAHMAVLAAMVHGMKP